MTVSDEIQINKQDLLLLLEKRGSIEGVKSRTQLAADLLGLISVIAVCCQFYGNRLVGFTAIKTDTVQNSCIENYSELQ